MAKGYLYDNGYELISREEALPDTSESSVGDVLSLDSDKEPVWSAPSGIIPKIRVRRHASGSSIQYSFYDLDGAILNFGDCLDNLCDSDGNVSGYVSNYAISADNPTIGEVVQFNLKENSSDNTKVDVYFNEFTEVSHSSGVSTVFFCSSGTKTAGKATNTITPTTIKFTVADQA